MRTGYAADILDFSVRFDTEEACFEYLRTIRWLDGFICPACSHRGGWWLKAYSRFECQACHRQLSPLSGTVMHRSHLPLRLWFWAAYFVSTHTPGISAVQLQRQLGIKKVDSAWYLLHRLRRGMVRQNRERLSGTVEADEAHIGGPVKGKAGRGVAKARTKTLIAGAVEIVTYTKGGNFREKAGRLRLAILKDAGENEIKAFLNRHVAEEGQSDKIRWVEGVLGKGPGRIQAPEPGPG